MPPPVTKSSSASREKIRFSFEHYDTNKIKYCLSEWSNKEIRSTLERLKDISSKSFDELMANRRVYHFYEVTWEKTIEPRGFPGSRLKNMTHFHFALLGVNKQLARVYGAYSSGTFYIVWFDLKHVIWPTLLRNT